MSMEQQTQERLADVAATGSPLAAVAGVNLAELNAVLETATLALGFTAGIISVAYRIWIWHRDKKNT